jgi:hypothetical protein
VKNILSEKYCVEIGNMLLLSTLLFYGFHRPSSFYTETLDSMKVFGIWKYGPGFWIRGLGVQDLGLNQDPLLRNYAFLSIT